MSFSLGLPSRSGLCSRQVQQHHMRAVLHPSSEVVGPTPTPGEAPFAGLIPNFAFPSFDIKQTGDASPARTHGAPKDQLWGQLLSNFPICVIEAGPSFPCIYPNPSLQTTLGTDRRRAVNTVFLLTT